LGVSLSSAKTGAEAETRAAAPAMAPKNLRRETTGDDSDSVFNIESFSATRDFGRWTSETPHSTASETYAARKSIARKSSPI